MLAMDPNNTFEIFLECDKEKPKAERPCFVYHYLTGRQWLKVAEVQEKLTEHESMAALVDSVYGGCRVGLVGWKNLNGPDGAEIPFDANMLEDILTLKEAQELVLAVQNNGPTVEDKKKFDSPSDLDTEVSAENAGAPKDAKASPPTASQS